MLSTWQNLVPRLAECLKVESEHGTSDDGDNDGCKTSA